MPGIYYVKLGQLLRVLEVLYKYYKEGKEPTVSDLIVEGRISSSSLSIIRQRLKEDGYITEAVNPDRTVTIKLTEKGVKLAECLLKCKELIK